MFVLPTSGSIKQKTEFMSRHALRAALTVLRTVLAGEAQAVFGECSHDPVPSALHVLEARPLASLQSLPFSSTRVKRPHHRPSFRRYSVYIIVVEARVGVGEAIQDTRLTDQSLKPRPQVLSVVIVNTLLTSVMAKLAKFERHVSLSDYTSTVTAKLALAQFLNTALIVIIVNAGYTGGGLGLLQVGGMVFWLAPPFPLGHVSVKLYSGPRVVG